MKDNKCNECIDIQCICDKCIDEIVSDCCTVKIHCDTDICSDCLEHCEPVYIG